MNQLPPLPPADYNNNAKIDLSKMQNSESEEINTNISVRSGNSRSSRADKKQRKERKQLIMKIIEDMID